MSNIIDLCKSVFNCLYFGVHKMIAMKLDIARERSNLLQK